MEIEFSQPILLPNIWATLGKLPSVFDDNDLLTILGFAKQLGFDNIKSDFQEKIFKIKEKIEQSIYRFEKNEFFGNKVSGIWNNLKKTTEKIKQTFEKGEEGIPMVYLSRITAAPEKHRKIWELEFKFSGEVIYSNRTLMPFDEVRLPQIIIPSFYAELEKLLSSNPFASANLKLKNIPIVQLMKNFAKPLQSFEGFVRFEGKLPNTKVMIPMHDGGILGFKTEMQNDIVLKTEYYGEITQNELEVNFKDIEIEEDGIVNRVDASLRLESGAEFKNLTPVEILIEHLFADKKENLFSLFSSLIRIHPDFSLSKLNIIAGYRHPLIKGGSEIPIKLKDINLRGYLNLVSDINLENVQNSSVEFEFSSNFNIPFGYSFKDAIVETQFEKLEGNWSGKLAWSQEQGFNIEVNGGSLFEILVSVETDDFPELNIEKGIISNSLKGDLDFKLKLKTGYMKSLEAILDNEQKILTMRLDGSEFKINIEKFKSVFNQYSFYFVQPIDIYISALESYIDATGYGYSTINVVWDFHHNSPILTNGETSVNIFVDELLFGNMNIKIKPSGALEFESKDRGLYDAIFFNGLIKPEKQLEKWIEVLKHNESFDKIFQSIALFSTEASNFVEKLRKYIIKFINILERENINKLGDFLPAQTASRIISMLLVDDTSYQKRIYDIFIKVVNAEGLDIKSTKALIDELYPEHNFDFEIDKGLKWLNLVLSPWKFEAHEELSLLTPIFDRKITKNSYNYVLTANEIYKNILSDAPVSFEFSKKLLSVLPYLSYVQLQWLYHHKKDDWDVKLQNRITYIYALKHRIRLLEEHFGGFDHLPQATAISFFLNAVTNDSVELNKSSIIPELSNLLGCSVLGPREVAILLRACLASPLKGRTVQINTSQLISMIKRQPTEFLKQVLYEISDTNPQILTNILYGLLEFSTNTLRIDVDIALWLSTSLNMQIPRRKDYMAGGKYASKSYYKALYETSIKILDLTRDYAAYKAKLQIYQHPKPSTFIIQPHTSKLLQNALKTIRKADKAGFKCTFSKREKKRQIVARDAYLKAFDDVKFLINTESKAITIPEIKKFISRNYEALMILSVVRNYQQSIDNVRYWIEKYSGKTNISDEQELLNTVINVMYYYPEDKKRLLKDPLVRLLIDPPEKQYNFSIISCMGVITEGAKGEELYQAFERLEQKRGIKIVRTDTQTARSLEFNASKIIEALDDITGHWGFIGYSQGCANALEAELELMGGTPEQRVKTTEFLVGRNLLFSAINGSSHGFSGIKKFQKAMEEGDKILKYYQTIFSSEFIDLFLQSIGKILDSRLSIHMMGGVHSLTKEGIIKLAEKGQFKSDIPTFTMSGIVTEENHPEALDFLSNVLTKQIRSNKHDTQVYEMDSKGHFVWLENEYLKVLENCDLGCTIQHTHHWSPLLKETEFITTTRDIENAIYDTPKDRHVFPWVDVMGRFGIIGEKSQNHTS